MLEADVGELVVVRMWSWRPAALRRTIDRDQRERGTPYGGIGTVSVFAVVVDDAGVEVAIARALASARVRARNSTHWGVTTSRRLQDEGFVIERDEGPPEDFTPDHHAIVATSADDTYLERLESIFNEQGKRRV